MRKFRVGGVPGVSGTVTVPEKPLGRGGEGSVYAVTGDAQGVGNLSLLVAKLYHEPERGDRFGKVSAMLAQAPDTEAVTWPVALLTGHDGSFVGYLMRKLDSEEFRPWSELSNTADRLATSPGFDVRYALTACLNLLVAVGHVHEAKAIVGDVNESNIFVRNDASVLIVDIDSAQVTATDGTVHRCLVGKPEYSAPELTGSFREVLRTPASDVFALGVAVFQMMTGGFHPTDGIWQGKGDQPDVTKRIRGGTFPALGIAGAYPKLAPNPRVPAAALPTRLLKVLKSALVADPSLRVRLDGFTAAISDIAKSLEQCRKVKAHWFDGRDGKCGWCRMDNDPWVKRKRSASQATLPSLTFGEAQQGPVVRRARTNVSSGPSRVQSHSPSPSGLPSRANYPGVVVPAPTNPQTSGPNVNPAPVAQTSGPRASGSGASGQNKRRVSPVRKGGRTILNYADGTSGPRPSLGVLFKSNPKLAWACVRSETPSLVSPWWGEGRNVARLPALLLGWLLGVGLSFSFLLLVAPAGSFVSSQWPTIPMLTSLASWGMAASSVTSVLGVTWLLLSGVWDMVRTRRKGLPLRRYVRDPFLLTMMRFVPVAFAFGPLFVIVLTALLAWSVLSAVLREITSPRR